MKVFLDTNVVVAAAATRGLCTDVMREVLARHDLVISQILIDEVKDVLKTKIGVPTELIAALVQLLRDGAELAEPSGSPEIALRDGPDRALLAAAASGKAEVFVTGDAELLGLRAIGALAIVSPRAFWELIKAGN